MEALGLLQLQVEFNAEDGELSDSSIHTVVAGQQARGTNLPQLHLLG